MHKFIDIIMCTIIYSVTVFYFIDLVRTIDSDLFISLLAGWVITMILHYFPSQKTRNDGGDSGK